MRKMQLVKTMGMAVALALPAAAQAQIWKNVPIIRDPNRTSTTTRSGGVYDPRTDSRDTRGIPPGQMPPAGMCRIWIDGVPPGRQPAPTDCATAERRRPANARVIYGDRTNGRYDTRNGNRYPTSGRTNDGWYRDRSGRLYRLERDGNGRVYRVYQDGQRVYEGNGGAVYQPNDRRYEDRDRDRRDRDDDEDDDRDDRYGRVNGRYGTYGADRRYDEKAAERAEKQREKERREWEKSQRKQGKGHGRRDD